MRHTATGRAPRSGRVPASPRRDLVESARKIVAGVQPQVLRESGPLHQQIQAQLAGVRSVLDERLIDRPRRRIARSSSGSSLNAAGPNAVTKKPVTAEAVTGRRTMPCHVITAGPSRYNAASDQFGGVRVGTAVRQIQRVAQKAGENVRAVRELFFEPISPALI